jgi:hypothetical protein
METSPESSVRAPMDKYPRDTEGHLGQSRHQVVSSYYRAVTNDPNKSDPTFRPIYNAIFHGISCCTQVF